MHRPMSCHLAVLELEPFQSCSSVSGLYVANFLATVKWKQLPAVWKFYESAEVVVIDSEVPLKIFASIR
jgi:hypothetical protein